MNDNSSNGGFGTEPKFRVFELIGATNRTFFLNAKLFARLGVLPAAIVIVLALAAQWIAPVNMDHMTGDDPMAAMNPATFWPHLAAGFIGFVILMAYTVACHRTLLLGEAPQGGIGISLGAREWKFTGYTFLVVFLLIAASMVIALPLAALNSVLGASVGMAANLTIISVLFVRFSLVFPMIAADAPGGLMGAWRLSSGHTINLFGAYLALYGVFFLLMIVPAMAAAGTSVALGGVGIMTIFNTVAQFVSAAYFACMLSLAYKVLAE